MVSALVRENRITLGEFKTDEKSKEITAVLELLEMLYLKGAFVSVAAMSCQTKIATRITENETDYVIGLKGNQLILLDDVKLFFESFIDECPRAKTLEKGHGRIEKREYFLSTEVDRLSKKADWANLNSIGAVKFTVEEKGKIRIETRY